MNGRQQKSPVDHGLSGTAGSSPMSRFMGPDESSYPPEFEPPLNGPKYVERVSYEHGMELVT